MLPHQCANFPLNMHCLANFELEEKTETTAIKNILKVLH